MIWLALFMFIVSMLMVKIVNIVSMPMMRLV